MKRHLATILIFLFLGAILNVAIAWGCCFWAINHSTIWADARNKLGYIKQELIKPIPKSVMDIHESHSPHNIQEYDQVYVQAGIISFGYDLYTHAVSSECIQDGMPVTDQVFATSGTFCGWPMPSISGFSIYLMQDARGGQLQVSHIGFFETEIRLLPFLPLWSGFIINTLFYAMILWLPYRGFFMLRRRRRIRRGKCGQCGYIVSVNAGLPGASPNCTECGTPLPKKPIMTSSV